MCSIFTLSLQEYTDSYEYVEQNNASEKVEAFKAFEYLFLFINGHNISLRETIGFKFLSEFSSYIFCL